VKDNEDYDYELYEKYVQFLLECMWRDPDELEIGENISDCPEVKIIFDGHGDLEDEDEDGEYRYTERGNKNMESYAVFIHKDTQKEDFEFPEHELTPWALIHRPKEEVCIYAWYDVENDYWEILPMTEDTDVQMTTQELMDNLKFLYDKYHYTEGN